MYRKNKIAAIIPARKANDKVTELNLKYLGDQPLITYTISAALESNFIDKIFLSTEDNYIAKLAKQYNIEVPFLRPIETTKPGVTSKDVAIYMLNEISEVFDVILLLMPNAPFRGHDIIDAGIEYLINNNKEKLRTVSKLKDFFISETELDERNQSLGDEIEFPNYSEKTVVGGGMYIYKFDGLLKKDANLPCDNFYIPRHEATLINSLYDLLIAERLVNINNSLINTLTDVT